MEELDLKDVLASSDEKDNIDPVSGNPVPVGSLPNEVRDDVDAKLSEGEYVLPADVVRFFGLSKIENLVAQAKKGLADMEAKGRIGGKQEDDLPFSPEELQAIDDMPAEAPQGAPQVQMAVGGMVPASNTTAPTEGSQGLPAWMLQFGETQTGVAPTEASDQPPITRFISQNGNSQADKDAMKPKGMAGSVDTWTPKDFVNYAQQRNSPVNRGIVAGINTFVPMGGLLTNLRQKYLEENVPKTMEEMLKTGKDLQGNLLDDAQKEDLRASYEEIKSEALPKTTSIMGSVMSGVKRAITGSGKTETRDGVTYQGVQRRSSDSSMNSGNAPAYSSSTRSNTTMKSSPRPQARPSTMKDGGLVKKRNK